MISMLKQQFFLEQKKPQKLFTWRIYSLSTIFMLYLGF